MKLNLKKRNTFLETCAASDMAFLLIIYFMVIAGFNLSTGFLMNLPLKDSTRLILKEDLIRFELNQDGEIIHEEEIIELAEAKKIIGTAQSENPDIAVVLSINKETLWQRVVSFVEVAQDLKIDSFSFAMKRETSETQN